MAEKKGLIAEFKEFIMRGNVLDMAIGIIIGGAFTAIVTSLVDDIINPIIGLLGSSDLAELVAPLGDTGVLLKYGSFISAIINFLLVALVLFLIIRAINKAQALAKKDEPEEEEAPAETELDVLGEIRTLLQEQQKLDLDKAERIAKAKAAKAADK